MALSLACGKTATAMPEVKSPFEGDQAHLSPAQDERIRSAQQELAKAKVASEDARIFKQSVSDEGERLTAHSRAGAAGAKASGPRPSGVVVTEKIVGEKALEEAPLGESPPKTEGTRTQHFVEIREGDAVVVARRTTVSSHAAGGKGSDLTHERHQTSAEQAWSAKNRFADDQFKLRQAEEQAAAAELSATKASVDRESTDALHWEGRAASTRRLDAMKVQASADSKVAYEQERVSMAEAQAAKSYAEWRETSPRRTWAP